MNNLCDGFVAQNTRYEAVALTEAVGTRKGDDSATNRRAVYTRLTMRRKGSL
jgi:hypothetical protein